MLSFNWWVDGDSIPGEHDSILEVFDLNNFLNYLLFFYKNWLDILKLSLVIYIYFSQQT